MENIKSTEELGNEIFDLIEEFKKEHYRFINDMIKTSAPRARSVTLRLSKLFKAYRAQSIVRQNSIGKPRKAKPKYEL